jgi:hypothetical protein
MLGHYISSKGIEVDKAKIDIISKLPPPMTVKGVRRISPRSLDMPDSTSFLDMPDSI